MAISVVGTKVTANNIASPSFAFSNYGNPTADDIVVVGVASGVTTGASAITVPSGWVNCHPSGGNTQSEADTCRMAMLYHVVTATEDTNNTTTYTLTNLFGGLNNWAGVAIVLRGVDAAAVIDSANTGFSSANSATPHVFPGLTGADLSDDSFVVGMLNNDGVETYASDPGGWTRQGYQNGANTAIICETRDALTVAGTDVTATNITPNAGDEYAGFTVAFTAASVAVNRSPAFTGSGALSFVVVEREKTTRNLTGTGVLAATRYPKHAVAAAFTGSGVLSATAAAAVSRSAALPGNGALAVTTVAKVPVTAAFTGAGALSATTYPTVTTAFTGAGALTATTVEREYATGATTGTGTLSATRYQKFAVPAAFTGNGALTATAYPKFAVAEAFTGAGALAPTATMYSIHRSASPPGPGALSASAYSAGGAAAVLTGTGALAATATMYSIHRSATLGGAGVPAATAYPTFTATGAFTGTGAPAASASMYSIHRSVGFPGAGVFSPGGFARFTVTGAFTGTGTSSATATMYQIHRPAPLTGAGTVSVGVSAAGQASATLTGQGVLTAGIAVLLTAGLTGHGALAASANEVTGIPIALLADSFGFQDAGLWDYHGTAAVVDGQLHLSGV